MTPLHGVKVIEVETPAGDGGPPATGRAGSRPGRHRPAHRISNRHVAGCFAAALLVCAAWVVLATVRMVTDDAVPVPILDQWAQLVGSRSVTLSWLVSQHNEHRLVFPRLVFIADRWLFAETGRLSLATSLALQACLAALLIRLGRPRTPAGWPVATGQAAVTVALLAWAVQYENYTWPFQVQFFGVILAAAACFATVALRGDRPWGVACATAFGVVAALTLSNGIAVLFLAAALAAWLRRPRASVAALAVAATATLALYLVGYQTPPEHTSPFLAAARPVALLGYATAMLGSPFAAAVGMLTGRIDVWLAEGMGITGIALLAAQAVNRRAGDASPGTAALSVLCLFVLATTVLTASGRLGFGVISAFNSRYATPALVFWACLWLLGTAPSARPRLAGALAACVLGLVVWTQPMFTGLSHAVAANRAIAMPALVAGVADATVIAPVYPTPDVPLQVRLTEFDTRTGAFSQAWAPWIGSRLHDHAVAADPSRCVGRYEAAIRVADPTSPGWRVAGSLDEPAFRGRRHIVALTDANDIVVGFGISDAGSTTLAAAGPAGEPARTGWVGAMTGTSPGQAQAYVLLDRFHAACPLRNEPRLESALQVALAGGAPASASPAGSVDAVYLRQQVTIDGWAMVQTEHGTPGIRIDTNLPVQSASIAAVARPDAAAALHDPRLAKAGFRVVLVLEPTALPARPRLCLWSEDALYGPHRLVMNPATEAQPLCPQ